MCRTQVRFAAVAATMLLFRCPPPVTAQTTSTSFDRLQTVTRSPIANDGSSGAPAETVAVAGPDGPVSAVAPAGQSLLHSDVIARAIAAEVDRMPSSTSAALTTAPLLAQTAVEHGNWIRRHPVLFGTLVGFGAGFLIGYLPGDDGVFDDFEASFNGLVIGGIGAGAGALVGWGVSR